MNIERIRKQAVKACHMFVVVCLLVSISVEVPIVKAKAIAAESAAINSTSANTPASLAICPASIGFGETVQCSITSSGETDSYTFTASAGDTILVRMSRSSGNVWPGIKVFSGITQLCQATGLTTAEISGCVLPGAGTYTIETYDAFNGTFTGDYYLHLQRLNNPASAVPIAFGQTLSGTIGTPAETDSYTFTVSAGDSVLVRMSRSSGNIWPGIKVFSGATQLCQASDLATAEISACALPGTGTYTIRAFDAFNGTFTGNYSLYLQSINNPVNAVSLTLGIPQEVEITSGSTAWFQIEVLSNTQNLYFTLQKYDSWSGEINLYSGSQLLASTSGYADQILQWPSPTAGTYLVEVSGSGSGRLTAYAALPELPLGQWVVGSIYNIWGSAWYQFNLPSNQSSIHLRVEALGLWSQLKVYRGELNGTLVGSASGASMNLDIASPQAGIYYVHLTDSAWIQGNDQTRDHMIRADANPIAPPACTTPTISSFTPDNGGNAGQVTVSISGQCLDAQATVNLTRSGYSNIAATLIGGADDQRGITATFSLSGVAPGDWNLAVTNPNSQSAVAPMPFTVESDGSTELWLEVLARQNMRVGQTGKVLIRVGNSGSIDARHLMVVVYIPQDIQWASAIEDYDSSAPQYEPELHDHLYFDILRLAPDDIEEIELSVTANTLTTWPLNVYLLEPFSNASSATTLTPEVTAAREVSSNETDLEPGTIIVTGPSGVARTGHVGIYVGNNQVVEVLVDGTVHGERTLDEFSREGGFFAGKLPDGANGAEIAQLAKQYIGTTQPYAAPALPTLPGSENCATFVMKLYRESGYPIDDHVPWGWLTAPADIYTWLTGKPWPKNSISDHVVWKYTGKIELIQFLLDQPTHGTFSIFRALKKFITSVSPEDKYGPSGYDSPDTPTDQLKHWIPSGQAVDYRIDFWNKEDAPAATVDVIITDILDPNLDWSTFKFTEVGFLDWKVPLEPSQYINVDIPNVSIDLSPYYPGQPTVAMMVNVEGTFDSATGAIRWEFHALDPITREPPENPFAGFLPPITDSGWEIGWVNFSVSPKSALTSGTVISNQSYVKFDLDVFKPAPPQGPFINTLDASPPTSAVQSLAATQISATFLVSWSGIDDTNGSGVYGFDIYVDNLSDANPPYLWRANTTAQSSWFSGIPGQTYGFYTRARDHVGNLESAPQPLEFDVEVTAGSNSLFGDTPFTHAYREYIEILYVNGYTGGCSTSPLLFCPDVIMDRAQAAVFMLRGNFGSGYEPVIPTHFFKDSWAKSPWAEGWAESMFLEGLTGGCLTSPLLFCPDDQLTNVQAAVFGLRLKYGTSYQPPTASGTVFADLTNVNFWGTSWAEQAYAEGLIPACGSSGGKPLFCPNNLVSRGFGASIIVKAKGLTMP